MDITCSPMACRSVVDWFIRRVMSWRLTTRLEIACIEAAEEALARYRTPDGALDALAVVKTPAKLFGSFLSPFS